MSEKAQKKKKIDFLPIMQIEGESKSIVQKQSKNLHNHVQGKPILDIVDGSLNVSTVIPKPNY